jgi:hypothetical protein
MNIQYISDRQGKHTAVVIPIDDWNKITTRFQDLKDKEKTKTKPSDFRGSISKKTADELLSHVDKARGEWERSTF